VGSLRTLGLYSAGPVDKLRSAPGCCPGLCRPDCSLLPPSGSSVTRMLGHDYTVDGQWPDECRESRNRMDDCFSKRFPVVRNWEGEI
jgi:hypothetical protein